MYFWDSSALVTLVVEQKHSGVLKKIWRKDNQAIIWWASEAECYGALCRLEKEGGLDSKKFLAAQAALSEIISSCFIVQPVYQVIEIAKDLLRIHSLRTADALQLAAAVCSSEKEPKYLSFICLDKRLRDAAQKQEFAVIPDSFKDA